MTVTLMNSMILRQEHQTAKNGLNQKHLCYSQKPSQVEFLFTKKKK